MSGEGRLVVASVTASMFIYGLILGLPSVWSLWPFVPSWATPYVYLTIPVGTVVGNLLVGRLADLVGRKPSFMITLAMYGAGAVVVILSRNLAELLAGLALTQVGLGGEMPALLAYLAEYFSGWARLATLIMVTDVANLGVLADGAILFHYQAKGVTAIPTASVSEALAIAIGATAAVVLATRFLMPESPEWASLPEGERGRAPQRMEGPGMAFRVLALTGMVIATALTYAFLALTIGSYLNPGLTGLFLVIYNIGEFVGGPASLLALRRLDVNSFTALSYVGGALSMLLAVPAYLRGSMPLFLAALLVNGVFGEMAWAARVVLEPLSFPTGFRGTSIAIVRLLPYALYAASLFYLANVGGLEYLAYNIGLWAVGALAAVAWYVRRPKLMG